MTKTSASTAWWDAAGADLMAVTHALFVGFVLWGEVLILVGAVLGWEWIYSLPFRGIHVALVLFVGVQDILGRVSADRMGERIPHARGANGIQ
jgi:hypothetical protein